MSIHNVYCIFVLDCCVLCIVHDTYLIAVLLHSANETSISILTCSIRCGNPRSPCIRKCCGPEEILDVVGGSNFFCSPSAQPHPWAPILHQFVDETSPPIPLTLPQLEKIRPHFIKALTPSCMGYLQIDASEKEAGDEELIQYSNKTSL
jgi:hypothetical protein